MGYHENAHLKRKMDTSKKLVTLYDHFFGEHFDDEKLVNILIHYLRIKNC